MKKQLVTSVAMAAVLAFGMSVSAMAQEADGSKEQQIDQRLQNQQQRETNGVEEGQMNGKHAVRDEQRDMHVQNEMARDASKNNGHITQAEQAKMNRQLNKNSHDIHNQRHNTNHMEHPGTPPAGAPPAGAHPVGAPPAGAPPVAQ